MSIALDVANISCPGQLSNSDATLEESFIVRRCRHSACRLLAFHPARLWIRPTGVLRVTVMCLKCGRDFGAAVKRVEWRYFDERTE